MNAVLTVAVCVGLVFGLAFMLVLCSTLLRAVRSTEQRIAELEDAIREVLDEAGRPIGARHVVPGYCLRKLRGVLDGH